METIVESTSIGKQRAAEHSITCDANEESRKSTGAGSYFAARREWDERYGSLISRAKNWRVVAILCALTTLLQTAGMISMSIRSKVVPYVVAVDSLGHQIAIGTAEQTTATDDRLKRAALYEWLSNVRTVTNDGVAQRKAIDEVYAQIANGSPAMTIISEFYRGNPPQKRAQTETVSVDVQSVLPTSDKTYQVEWTETARDLQGEVKAQNRWKGAFTIGINPPTDERLIRVNPIGIYVTQMSWTQVL